MKAEIAELWAADLESGEHKQAKGILCNLKDMSFCCMGRLCELAYAAGVCDKTIMGGEVSYGGEDQIPPESVLAWAGLHGMIASADFDYGWLMHYNDTLDYTFPQIASKIRTQKEQL